MSALHRRILLFEGRDGAGKTTAIAHLLSHLDLGATRVVHLPAPTLAERKASYFKRFQALLPQPGESLVLDRSWYNRVTVEAVMGYATPEEVQRFLNTVNAFEDSLLTQNIHLLKLYLTVDRDEQARRLARRTAPSLIDRAALAHWDAYTRAEQRMLACDAVPWHVIDANRRDALNEVVRFVSVALSSQGASHVSGLRPVRVTEPVQR